MWADIFIEVSQKMYDNKQLSEEIVETAKTQKFAEMLEREFPASCQHNFRLAPHTSYKVGGPADAFVTPRTQEELEHLVRLCLDAEIPYFVLGEGANILVHDDGYRGVVISLQKCCDRLFHQDGLLYTGTGVAVRDLVLYCEDHGLAGLDFMSGIPGTVGGALIMNAGAFVGEIGDRVMRIEALNEQGQRVQLTREEAQFGYRRADGLIDKLLLGCWIAVESGDQQQLHRSREDYLKRRAEKQPLEFPSCGSVFKRPPGDYAGRLIEAVGGKGLTVGGAKVSEKHANFIVNFNQATAADIYGVIYQVLEKVYQQFQIWLELEVRLIGFPQSDVDRLKGAKHGR